MIFTKAIDTCQRCGRPVKVGQPRLTADGGRWVHRMCILPRKDHTNRSEGGR